MDSPAAPSTTNGLGSTAATITDDPVVATDTDDVPNVVARRSSRGRSLCPDGVRLVILRTRIECKQITHILVLPADGGVKTIHRRRSGTIPDRDEPQNALVLGVCSLSRLCSQTSRLTTGIILGLGNRGNLVVELLCQSLQASGVWHFIRIESGIVPDDGGCPLLHISLDLRRGPFLEPAKERAGDDRRVLPQESCDVAVGGTARAVRPSTKNSMQNEKAHIRVARADDLGVAWQLWEAGHSRSRRRRRRRIVFHDDRQNMVSMASRVELSPNGGIHRIIPVTTKRATGAKLGRFTRFRPNFTQNSRSVEVVGHQRDFGAILVRHHWHTYLFLLQPQES